MGEQIKKTGNEMKERWQQKMPKFFKAMMMIFICIGGTVVSIHVAFGLLDITAHEWWTEAEPLVLGISIGGAFSCKFTCDGGFREKVMEKMNRTILDSGEHPHGVSSHSTNMSDVDTVSPGENPESSEIEPYNEHLD